jgi:hypothetical protein
VPSSVTKIPKLPELQGDVSKLGESKLQCLDFTLTRSLVHHTLLLSC